MIGKKAFFSFEALHCRLRGGLFRGLFCAIFCGLACSLLSLFSPGIPQANSQSIYVWTDEAGNKHFSSTPDHPNSVASDLPQIQHENIDSNIKKLKAETPPSCEKHGGVDCPSGADSDGSVICRDGFRGAKLPFRFECLEARLKTEFLARLSSGEKSLKIGKDLQAKLGERSIQELYLSVRNMSGVQAIGVKTEIRIPGKAPIPLSGPETIDAYGQTDFSLPATDLIDIPLRDIAQARYRVSCTNCSTSLGVN